MELIRGICDVTLMRLCIYLAAIGKEELLAPFPELARDDADINEKTFNMIVDYSLDKNTPYGSIVRYLSGGNPKLTDVARTFLYFVVTSYIYPQMNVVLKKINYTMVTVELAFMFESIFEPSYRDMKKMYDRGKVIFKTENEPVIFFHEPFYGDDRLIAYLCEDGTIDEGLRDVAVYLKKEEELPPIMVSEDIYGKIVEAVSEEDNTIVVKGGKGVGKKFLLKHAHKELGKDMLLVNANAVLAKKDINEIIRLIKRERFFNKCGVCIYAIEKSKLEKLNMTEQEFINKLVTPLIEEKAEAPLCLCCDTHTDLLKNMVNPTLQFTIDYPARKDRIRIWDGYAEYYQIEIDAIKLGTEYRLSAGEIDRVCAQLGLMETDSVSDTVYEMVPPILTRGTIEPYHHNCTIDDLVVPNETKKKINEICSQVWYSNKVYDEWDMENKYAYGKAVSILLSGAPGTGKTMTARVIANMLKLPLYRVNLSQLVDKYIGETEKHLEEIFANAEQSNIILFFDEADAVFGKRSEINDSKDKYANTEVSYILQRIESYEGVVILATNYESNIDTAFMRRIKYVLHFNMPDKDERLRLWKGSFTDEVPIGDIDFEYLAAQFEFSPSTIKNIILSATFVAASKGTDVDMEYIIAAIKDEYLKSGRPMLSSDLGRYAYLY